MQDKKEIMDCDKTEFVRLTSFASDLDVDIAMEILKKNDIACFKKHKGAGQYFYIISRYSVFGVEIYVKNSQLEVAKELIESLQLDISKENVTETDEYLAFYKNKKNVARMLIVFIILQILLVLIFNFF